MNNEIGLKDRNGKEIELGDIIILIYKDAGGGGYDSFTHLGEVKKGWFDDGYNGGIYFGFAIAGYSWSNFNKDKDEEKETALIDDFFLMENGNLDAEIIGNAEKDKVEDLMIKYRKI